MTETSPNVTEADFEAAIAQVIRKVFPMLTSSDVRHQCSFRIHLGHRTHEITGGAAAWAAGRSDVVLVKDGQPLAVLELKRRDLALTDSDRRQGLSYARLMDPWPPLVIVSSGRTTRIFETFAGKEWQEKTIDEKSLANLMTQSARIADSDMKHAVETLLGPGPTVWVQVVREFTDATMTRLTGPWKDVLSPFAEKLVFPRKAAGLLAHCIEHDKRIPLIIGSPLSGKSNVLREFILNSFESEDYAVLLVDADSSSHGLFQTLANLMSIRLGWNFGVDHVRSWLRRLSNADSGPSLVLAVDGGDADALRPELDELVSDAYGPKLRLAVAVDEGAVDKLVLNSTGRQRTAIGRKVAGIRVGPLDDEEFLAAQTILEDYRIGFYHGSHRATEYRVPWLLRTVASMITTQEHYQDETRMAVFPSVPGPEMLFLAEQRIVGDDVLRGRFAGIAEAIIADLDAADRSTLHCLRSVHGFVCRTSTVHRYLQEGEVAELIEKGYLKPSMLPDGERLLVPQLPTLVGIFVARRLARLLLNDLSSQVKEATDRLVYRCVNLPFGDVLGASALFCAASEANGLPLEIVSHLLEKRPRREPIPVGSKAVGLFDDKRFDIEILDHSIVATMPDGDRVEIPHDEDDAPPMVHTDITAWLVLSHLSAVPLALLREGKTEPDGWLDPSLLIELATCGYVLRRPVGDGGDRILVHELDDEAVVCHEEGLVEPITVALLHALSRGPECGNEIINLAKQFDSLPLFSRLNIALLHVEQQADIENAEWARAVRRRDILPRLKNTLLDH